MPAHAHQLVPLVVEHTIDSLMGGIFLAAIAWAWLRLARRQNSASRFFILFILLIGIAVLPVVGFSWIRHSALSSGSVHSLVTLPPDAAEYLFLGWAVTALFLSVRIAIGFVQLCRLKRSCISIPRDRLEVDTQDVLEKSLRAVELCVSERVNVPTALGFTSPAKIAIPRWLLDQLSPAELHHVILHELAHLRRWDDWTTLAQRLLGAWLFFHPAVWWLQNQISLEREMACDECVLTQTGDARGYAKSLAAVAERSLVRRTLALAQAAVSHLHQTTQRVAKILSPVAPRRAYSFALLLVSVVSFSGLTVAAAFYSPDLVSFKHPSVVPKLNASLQPPADLGRPALQPTLTGLKSTVPAPRAISASLLANRPSRRAIKPRAEMTTARAETVRPQLIAANAGADRVMATGRPALLVVWQTAYSSNGSVLFVERAYWHVLVFQQVNPKEQSKKAI